MERATETGVASRMREVVAAHFDPTDGTPFWLERQRALGIDARRALATPADLALLGPFDAAWLRERPLEEFVPPSLWRRRTELVLAETGGTSGPPLRAVFTRDEFVAAFGAPFTAVSSTLNFPTDGRWLFVGPSGPHVIGQAARLLARLHGALEPFAVDFDPRWARAQEPSSLGESLYREHVLMQALDVVARESVDVLFVTPPLALALAETLDATRRAAIRGIHLGGMAISASARARLATAFPRAVILPAYGNSLFGILVEPRANPGAASVDYFPHGDRLLVDVVADGEDVSHPVAPGERGRVMLTRLDRSFFLPNVVERDVAEKVLADPAARALGLGPIGLRDPAPLLPEQGSRGLY